jgi:transposase
MELVKNMVCKHVQQLLVGLENLVTLIGKPKPHQMAKTPEQQIMELEAKVMLLEKQKAHLEQQVNFTDKKAIIFDMLIDIAEKEYNIDIRKNSSPEQLSYLKKNKNKP